MGVCMFTWEWVIFKLIWQSIVNVVLLPDKTEYMVHTAILNNIFGLYAKFWNNNAE